VIYTLDSLLLCFFFFQAEDGIRDSSVTGVQTCALPISSTSSEMRSSRGCQGRPPSPRMPPSASIAGFQSVTQFRLGETRKRMARSEERRVGKECGTRWWGRRIEKKTGGGTVYVRECRCM